MLLRRSFTDLEEVRVSRKERKAMRNKSKSNFFGVLMYRSSSAKAVLVQGCTTNCAVLDDICKTRLDKEGLSLRNRRDEIAVVAPTAAWSGI